MDIICQNLCKENDCELIFCCEYGSRLFGYHKKDSDYDLRGIYIRKNRKYYRYFPFTNYNKSVKNDMIVSKKSKKVADGGGDNNNIIDIDIELWDIRKVISLYFTNFNQTPVSWLTSSNIIYYKTDKSDRLTDFLVEKNKELSKMPVLHYYGLARSGLQNYKHNTHKIKKYIYSRINLLLGEREIFKFRSDSSSSSSSSNSSGSENVSVEEKNLSFKKKYIDELCELSELRKDKDDKEKMKISTSDMESFESRLNRMKLILDGMKDDDKFIFDETWENVIDLIIYDD